VPRSIPAWQPLAGADQDDPDDPASKADQDWIKKMYAFYIALVKTRNYDNSLRKLFSITSPFSLYPFFSNNFECRNGAVS